MRDVKFRGWFDDIGMQEITDINTNCILMQYTGLKDCKGKEIYEGDILKEREFINVVEWNASKGAWQLEEFEDDMGNSLGYSKYVVIGNRFENPELLKTN